MIVTLRQEGVSLSIRAVVVLVGGGETFESAAGPCRQSRAMAHEAEALREERARIIKAEVELEAARELRQAADEIMRPPTSLELLRMQMLTEVGAEQNTMTIAMMPSEFVEAPCAFARSRSS
jgi:hypothetical protein